MFSPNLAWVELHCFHGFLSGGSQELLLEKRQGQWKIRKTLSGGVS